ncbi:hypothetical protein Tco_1451304 [Tanacetum coccineum]
METATLGDKVLLDIVFGYGFNNDGDKLINIEHEVTSSSSMVAMAQEKAQEDDQDDAEGKEKRKFVPRQNLVNFFFTNFPSKFARFYRVGNLQTLENRLNRIRIGRFKVKANIARFERGHYKSKQGCNKVDWLGSEI